MLFDFPSNLLTFYHRPAIDVTEDGNVRIASPGKIIFQAAKGGVLVQDQSGTDVDLTGPKGETVSIGRAVVRVALPLNGRAHVGS